MARLKAIQQSFVDYIRDGDASVLRMVVGDDRLAAGARLSIYANAYRRRLRETLETDHPVLSVYLGDALFETLVNGYIDRYPSRSPNLRHFCDRLVDYINETMPFSEHPVLADIARFEQLLLRAFDAADAPVASEASLVQWGAGQWPGMTVVLHPSLQLFTPKWNAAAIWLALKDNGTPPAAGPAIDDTWLIWRNPERLTEFRSAGPAEVAALHVCADGGTFADLCAAVAEHDTLDSAARASLAYLTAWIRAGIASELRPGA